MRRCPVALVLVLCAVACRAEIRDVVVAEGEAFFAVVDADGVIVDRGRFAATSGPRPVSSDDAQTLFVWTFPPNTLVDASAIPLDDAALDDVTLSIRPPCGRCRAIADRLPQLLLPGDDCPMSPDVVLEAYDADGHRVERDPPAVVLSRAGNCAAGPEESVTTSAVEACPLWPVDGPVVARHSTLGADGTVYGINEGFMYAASVSGRTIRRTPTPHRKVRAVGLMPDGNGALYAARPANKGDFRTSYFRVSPSLEIEELVGVEATIQVDRIVRLVAEPEAVYLVGSVGGEAGIARCEVSGSRLTCSTEPVALAGCLDDDDLIDASGLVSGGAISIHHSGVILSRFRPGEVWQCDPRFRDEVIITPNGTRFMVDRLLDAASLDDRWFACATGEGGAVVLTGTVATNGTLGGARLAHFESSGTCSGMGVFPHRPTELAADLGRATVVLANDGTVVDRCTGNECATLGFHPAGQRSYFRTDVTGRYAAVFDDLGGAHVRTDTDDFVSVYGTADPRDRPTAHVVPFVDDSAAVFMGARAPLIVRRRNDTCTGVDVTPLDGTYAYRDLDGGMSTMGSTFPPFVSQLDSAGGVEGSYWLAGRAPSFVRHVDLVERTVTDRSTMLGEVEAIGALDASRAILATDDDVLLATRDLELTVLGVEWDDPQTPVVEDAVLTGGRLRAVAAVDGVAWVLGGRRIIRIVPELGGTVRAEGWWSHRLTEAETEFTDFRVVRAVAADRLIVGATDLLSSGRRVLTTWRIGPGAVDCPELPGDPLDLTICPFNGFDLTASNAPENDDVPVALVGPESTLTWFFPSSGVVYRFADDLVVSPFRALRTAAQRDGWIVFGGRGSIGFTREVGP